jgi:[protein-PII] uridylyltransferase
MVAGMRQERFAEKVQAAAAKQLVFKPDTKPADRLATYKQFWKVQQHRLLMEHNAGGGGREVANARALLLDVLLQNIFAQALQQACGTAVPVTLVAVGGYGRGELCPYSDVDIMFLHAGKAKAGKNDPYVTAFVEAVLYTLWDLGFKVGHSTRTVEEAVQQANADIKNKTALIESRPVAGPVELHEQFAKALLAQCVKSHTDDYIAARLADQRDRHEKYGDSPYMQEPNIKEGCGSLRDLQNLLWMAYFKYRVHTLAELRKEGFLEKAEQRDLEQAHDFLLRCRTALHYLTNRASDVIVLNIQPKLAAEFGYRQHDVLRRTEEFMRDYYTHARNIFLLTNALARRMALTPEKPSRLPALLQRRPKREEIDGFVLVNGVIFAGAPGTLRQQPLRLLRVFALAQQRGAELSPELHTQIRAHLHLVDRRLQTSPEARDVFLEILRRRGQVGRVLRWMHETGVLGKFLPEFGRLTCLVQHEFFHRYAADEHTLRVVENLDRVVDVEQEKYKGYRRLFLQLEHPEVLYLAVLLHDVGRSANKSKHADESLVAAQNVARRLRLNEDETAHLLLLVKEHTKLAILSQRRDIDDQATVDAAARVVGDQANLDMLLLLTFADSMGTGPQMWTDWKEALLWQLYDRTKHELGGTERARHILAKRIEQLYGEVSKQLAKKLHLEEIYSHFELMPASYYINTSADQVAGHLGLVHKFLARQQEVDSAEDALAPVIEWHSTASQSHTRIAICTWDRVGLFSKICGAVSSAGLNILSAHIYTRGDQVVLDFFDVCDANLGPVTDERACRQTEDALTKVLTGRGAVDFDQVLAQMHATRRQPARLHEARIPTVIEFDNEISASRTVVEIQTEDRLGLLFTLTQTLTALGLDISFAKISTEKGAAIDTFYVQDQLGEQVTDSDRLAAIRTKLEDALRRLAS